MVQRFALTLNVLSSVRLHCPPLRRDGVYYENGYKMQSILGKYLRCVMNTDVPTYNRLYNLKMESVFSYYHQQYNCIYIQYSCAAPIFKKMSDERILSFIESLNANKNYI